MEDTWGYYDYDTFKFMWKWVSTKVPSIDLIIPNFTLGLIEEAMNKENEYVQSDAGT